jgi:hypothetical protein
MPLGRPRGDRGRIDWRHAKHGFIQTPGAQLASVTPEAAAIAMGRRGLFPSSTGSVMPARLAP